MPSAGEVVGRGPAAVRAQRPTRPRRSDPGRAPARARRRPAGPARRAGRRTSQPRSARCSWPSSAATTPTATSASCIGYPGQVALTLRSWEYPAYLEDGLIDAVLARGPVWRDPAPGSARSSPGRAADLRGALVADRRVARRRTTMATTAPDPTQAEAAGWLDPFLADWRPGTGAPHEVREPASGRPLLTLPAVHARGRRPRRRRGRRGPARLGRHELRRARRGPPPGGGHLRGAPPGVRDVDPARDRRGPRARCSTRPTSRPARSTPPRRCRSSPTASSSRASCPGACRCSGGCPSA